MKAAKLRVTQKMAAVDTALIDLQKVVDALQQKPFKDALTLLVTPLTKERTRIGTLTVPAAQEASVDKLEKDVAAVKKTADNRAGWEKWLKDTWDKDSKNIKDWIGVLKEQAPKGELQTEFDALQEEKNNVVKAGTNLAALQKTCHPKLIKIYNAAHSISEHGPEVDLEIHKLRNLVVRMLQDIPDTTVTHPLANEFDALSAEKKQTWPGGTSAAAISTAIANFDAKIKALRDKAQAARDDHMGGDLAMRAKQIKNIQQTLEHLDHTLSAFAKTDWGEVAKLPPEESGPLLKVKAKFEAATKTYKALDARLKKVLPYAKRNPTKRPQAIGKEVVTLNKEADALLEEILKPSMKLAMKKKGAKEIDDLIASLPDKISDPTELALCKAAIEARYGIKIEIGDDFNAKSLPRIGKMLARVPEWQSKQSKKKPDGSTTEKSLKTLTYQSEPSSKGNYYSSNRKTIALQDITEKGGQNDEHTLVADSGKVVKTSYFDFTTLHEIGHAVDDRIKFMGGRMDKDGFGKWKRKRSIRF